MHCKHYSYQYKAPHKINKACRQKLDTRVTKVTHRNSKRHQGTSTSRNTKVHQRHLVEGTVVTNTCKISRTLEILQACTMVTKALHRHQGHQALLSPKHVTDTATDTKVLGHQRHCRHYILSPQHLTDTQQLQTPKTPEAPYGHYGH